MTSRLRLLADDLIDATVPVMRQMTETPSASNSRSLA